MIQRCQINERHDKTCQAFGKTFLFCDVKLGLEVKSMGGSVRTNLCDTATFETCS